jgi:hypothetical protein
MKDTVTNSATGPAFTFDFPARLRAADSQKCKCPSNGTYALIARKARAFFPHISPPHARLYPCSSSRQVCDMASHFSACAGNAGPVTILTLRFQCLTYLKSKCNICPHSSERLERMHSVLESLNAAMTNESRSALAQKANGTAVERGIGQAVRT